MNRFPPEDLSCREVGRSRAINIARPRAGPVGTSLTTSVLTTVAGAFNRTQMWESVLGVL
jgi:hypothetical protein